MSTVTLILGPRSYLDATGPVGPDDTFVVVPVPPGALSGVRIDGDPVNSLVLTWRGEGEAALSVARAGQVTPAGPVAWSSLVQALLVTDEVERAARAAQPTTTDLTPLFVWERRDEGSHVWSRIRLGIDDALFVRVTPEPLDPALDTGGIALAASAAHRRHSVFLNNHQRYYYRMFDGEEIEHKYVLDPRTDIWRLTVELYATLRSGGLPGFRMEYGDEFQTWDYLNYLFEVTGPPEEQGYISFIPLSVGGYTIKRKWFARDAVRRRERHYHEPSEVADLAGHLRQRFGVEPHALPPFRRVRYDVNFESARTGHLYGIYIDHCRLVDSPDIALVQCELEYMRTRTVLPTHEADVFDELELVARWLEDFFAARGIPTSRGIYSKLSFLRDVVAGTTGVPATGIEAAG